MARMADGTVPEDVRQANGRRSLRRLRYVAIGLAAGVAIALVVYLAFHLTGDGQPAEGTAEGGTGAGQPEETPIWERFMHLTVIGAIGGAVVGLLVAGATEVDETPEETREADAAAARAHDGRPSLPTRAGLPPRDDG